MPVFVWNVWKGKRSAASRRESTESFPNELDEGRRGKVLQLDAVDALDCHDTFANFSPPLACLPPSYFYVEPNEKSREKEAPRPRIQRSTYLIFWLNGSRTGFQFTLKTLNVVPLFTWKSHRRAKSFLMVHHQSPRDAEVPVSDNLFIFAGIFNGEDEVKWSYESANII